MADERLFIDLTGSSSPPPSPTRSPSPALRSLSTLRRNRQRRNLRTICLNCAIRLISNSNRFHATTCNHANSLQVPVPAVTNHVPPVMNELGGSAAAGATSLYPYGSNWNQPWIPHHDLFMLGMVMQWQNRLISRIARSIAWNTMMTTPPPVQSYANSFSGQHSPTCPHYAAAPTTGAADQMITTNENLWAAPNMSSDAVMPNPELLPLFPAVPENNALALAPPQDQGNGMLMMQTGADSTLMTADGYDDLDLELNLGGGSK